MAIRRLPQLPDGCPPDKNRQSSRTRATSETQQSVESDSNHSSSPDEDDRSYKRRKRSIRGKDQLSVHASEDESVDAKLHAHWATITTGNRQTASR